MMFLSYFLDECSLSFDFGPFGFIHNNITPPPGHSVIWILRFPSYSFSPRTLPPNEKNLFPKAEKGLFHSCITGKDKNDPLSPGNDCFAGYILIKRQFAAIRIFNNDT